MRWRACRWRRRTSVVSRGVPVEVVVKLLYFAVQGLYLRATGGVGMFDVDDLIAECRAAGQESEPRRAMQEVLARAVSDPGLAEALPPTRAEIVPLHVGDDLTILKVVWAPGMSVGPHDHRTWVAPSRAAGSSGPAMCACWVTT